MRGEPFCFVFHTISVVTKDHFLQLAKSLSPLIEHTFGCCRHRSVGIRNLIYSR